MDVLLVEDEPSIRELLCEDLVDAGFAVALASNAEEGLQAVIGEKRAPAVLVTDVNLGPGMDGLALAEEARRRWPDVAVVIITGDERNLDRLPAGLGCPCFVKPFEPVRLVTAVNSLMERLAC